MTLSKYNLGRNGRWRLREAFTRDRGSVKQEGVYRRAYEVVGKARKRIADHLDYFN